jgi:hypothetical protein
VPALTHPTPLRRIHAPEKADFIPQAHRRQLKHRHRLAAVDFALLRQISNVFALQILPHHFARIGLEQAHHCLEQRGFARAVGAEHRPHLSRAKHHIQMVHGRPALIAHGQIFNGNAHAPTAQKYTPPISASAAKASSRR